MRKSMWGVLAALVIWTAGAQAAHGNFDARIDSWVEGTIVALDADAGTFTVRGKKLPVASTVAQMRKEIATETARLAPEQREARSREIQAGWQDELATAQNQQLPASDSDYSFALPEDGKLSIVSQKSVGDVAYLTHGSTFFNGQKREGGALKIGDLELGFNWGSKDNERAQDVSYGADREEALAMQSLKDLKIGQRVMIGYDDGILTNSAHTVVKQDGAGHSGKEMK